MIYSLKKELPQDLLDALMETFGASRDALISKDKSEPIASIRLMIIKLLIDRGWSMDSVGECLRRDRSTPFTRIKDHAFRMEKGVDKNYKESFDALMNELEKDEDKELIA